MFVSIVTRRDVTDTERIFMGEIGLVNTEVGGLVTKFQYALFEIGYKEMGLTISREVRVSIRVNYSRLGAKIVIPVTGF